MKDISAASLVAWLVHCLYTSPLMLVSLEANQGGAQRAA